MQWHFALHMHGKHRIHGCECMVGKSTLRLVFDWVSLISGTTESHDCMKRKICVGYQQEGIDPPSNEKHVNYGQA